MEEKENKLLSLTTPTEELTNRILSEEDIDEFNKIKNLFDLNMKKKEILRLNKLNDLQDLTVNEMSERLSKKSGEFSNQDLLGYFKTIQDTIGKSNTSMDDVDMSSIRVIQNQLNININKDNQLPRESKQKVIEVINSILSKAESLDNVIDVEPIQDSEENVSND